MELRALEKGFKEKDYAEWDRTRMLAHTIYLFMPYGGADRELDRTKFFPLPMDKIFEQKKKEVRRKAIRITKRQIEFLDKLFDSKR